MCFRLYRELTIKILIVGNSTGTSIGASFSRAASALGIEQELADTNLAYRTNWMNEKINWHLFNKRPAHLNRFNSRLLKTVERFQPDILLTTGIAPLTQVTLKSMCDRGITCINYQTDDPWNPAHRTNRYLQSLPEYHYVFYPRQSTQHDLENLCSGHCYYLPFAYDPDHFFAESTNEPTTDIAFVGAAELFRASCLSAAAGAGMDMRIHGLGWEKYPNLTPHLQGFATVEQVRASISQSAINACFVRRSNRDGHCMRTFEVPASGGCMLAERTAEHQAILGKEGDTVLYFSSPEEMVEKATYLLKHPEKRNELARKLQIHITTGGNTYLDRLNTILETISV